MNKPKNKHAQALRKLGRGVHRQISDQERKRRRLWMHTLNRQRRTKRKQ